MMKSLHPSHHCEDSVTVEESEALAIPASNIDFNQSGWDDLRPPHTPTKRRFIFQDCDWLGGGHDGYPLLSLDTYLEVRCPDVFTLSAREYAGLMQAFWTFGLLEDTMRIKIPERFLLSFSDDGAVKFSAQNIPVLLRDWRYRVRKLFGNPELSRRWAMRVESAIRGASHFFSTEVTHAVRNPFRRAALPEITATGITCMIGAVAESLLTVLNTFPHRIPPQSPTPYTFNLLPTGWLREKLTSDGWCPFAVSILAASGLVALGYASTQQPFSRGGMDDHRACTRDACTLNDIDVAHYTNKHVHDSCTCAHSSVLVETVQASLSEGVVPVLVPQGTGLAAQSASHAPYVAISHVWADGLGSDTERGLPTCQINRLIASITSLLPEGAFWMDTLCIPHEQRSRQLAIGLMARTYADATAVLVLDAGIRNCSKAAPKEERLLRVLTSGWMQRMWTLQEGMLARKLYFEFSDGIISFDELIPLSEEDECVDPLIVSLATEVYRLSTYQSGLTRGRKPGEGPSPFSIAHIARALRWRSTKRVADETLAISGLLHVDAGELVKLPWNERMKTLLLRVGRVDPHIVFLPGDKLSVDGFTWAPRTLMTHGSANMSIGREMAVCTPSGLLAEYAIILFADTEIDPAGRYAIRDKPTGQTFSCGVVVFSSATKSVCNALLVGSVPGRSGFQIAAAVYVEGPGEEPEDHRLVCQFRQRMFLRGIRPESVSEDPTIVATIHATTGRAQVIL
ncbi:hypothetical protein C8Q74DRAFT_1284613, partial [Fomes fomentarius]